MTDETQTARVAVNTLKVRDDIEPVEFTMEGANATPVSQNNPSWVGEDFGREALRMRIEPWLTSLVQADHLNLVIGSGLTTGIQQIAGVNPPASMESGAFVKHGNKIVAAAAESARLANRQKANIEDEIRTANQLLRGLEILQDAEADHLRDELSSVLESFTQSVLEGERLLAEAESDKRDLAFRTLASFLMSFSTRTGVRDRLGLFTTNYDRLLEVGADLAGIHLIDRFVGKIAPIFRSSRVDLDLHYNPPGIRGEPRYVEGVARFTKLHGSLDWIDSGASIQRMGVPFGATDLGPYLSAPGLELLDPTRLMIYPNASKDRETAEFPYVELFRDLAAAVVRPNTVTVTYGYSFGDEHINRVLQDALTIPSTHLVIIAYGDDLGRISDAFESWGRKSQISLLLGPELARIENLTTYYLPKPSINLTSRRMGELLRQRYGDVGSTTVETEDRKETDK